MAPFKHPFPIWYNANARCDYHVGIPGHSTKNCIALKYKVQNLIKLGKLKFEESNELVGVEGMSGAKAKNDKARRKGPKGSRL